MESKGPARVLAMLFGNRLGERRGEHSGFRANRALRRGYIRPRTNRDPSGQLVVVSGASQTKSWAMAAGPTPSRSKSELGIRPGSGAGTRRAERATNGLVILSE